MKIKEVYSSNTHNNLTNKEIYDVVKFNNLRTNSKTDQSQKCGKYQFFLEPLQI